MAEETTTPSTSEAVEAPQVEATVVDGTTVTETSYLDGKYKSVTELEKGYKELQSTFTKKTQEYNEKVGAFKGAPEAYELPENAQVSEGIVNWAKENQFSNEALNSLVETYNKDMQAQQEAYVQAETQKLGENAKARIKNATDWVNANLGDLGPALNSMAAGAKGIEAIEKLISLTKATSPAATPATPSIDKDKLDYMQFQEKDANGERRYVSDPSFRNKVLQMRAQLIQ